MHNTRTRTRNPNFLVKPDPNPTRSQKALLVKAWWWPSFLAHRPGPSLSLSPPSWPEHGPQLWEATSGWWSLFWSHYKTGLSPFKSCIREFCPLCFHFHNIQLFQRRIFGYYIPFNIYLRTSWIDAKTGKNQWLKSIGWDQQYFFP